MLLRQCFLAVTGFCAGSVIAAGIFAFLTIIGIFTRVIAKTTTQRHIMLFETMLILGGILGNYLSFARPSLVIKSQLLLGIAGLSVGMFVGCLVMSLSETLKAFPVFGRRIHLAVGIQYIVISIGMGKMVSSLLYFAKGLSIGIR